MKHLGKIIIVILLFGMIFWVCSEKASITYPVTKKVDQVDDYHGTKVKDPYRWLEDINSPETTRWVNAQEKVTEQYMAGIEVRSGIKKRLTELWNYERYSSPRKVGEYYVFYKNDGLRDHSVLYIQKGLDGNPEVLLNPNTFSKDGSVRLSRISFSKNHKYISYAISRSGSDWREIYVMEVKTRKILKDHIKWMRFSSIYWYKDGFFYSRYEKPKEGEEHKAILHNHMVYYHNVGTPQSEDKLVYQDLANPKRVHFSVVSENEEHLLISITLASTDNNLLYYKKPGTDDPITPLIDKTIGDFSFVEELDGRLLLLTDYKAPNLRLISIDPKKPAEEDWKVILPESGNKLVRVSIVGGRLIAQYLKDAIAVVTVFDLTGKKLYDVKLPGVGTIFGFSGKKEDNEVFYTFYTFNVPPTQYRYNIKENKSELFRKPKVKFNPDDYITRQVFFHSKDKTRVPLFLAHKKGLKPDGLRPTMLFGYGGYGILRLPFFRPAHLVLLENGGIFAMACIRGGGEYGDKWHEGGMLENKQNSFDDFIAAAEYLIRENYTSPPRLAVWGVSNGGLLVGAVINQRPELFGVAIPSVAVMDMLRFHKFTIGWASVSEFGSSENPEQFKYLYAYSPLHNIKEGLNYPAVLALTADHDNRVLPAHSYKYIATLQEKYTGKNPVLIHIERKGGHGVGSVSSTIEEYTNIYAFMFYNMNIKL